MQKCRPEHMNLTCYLDSTFRSHSSGHVGFSYRSRTAGVSQDPYCRGVLLATNKAIIR